MSAEKTSKTAASEQSIALDVKIAKHCMPSGTEQVVSVVNGAPTGIFKNEFEAALDDVSKQIEWTAKLIVGAGE